MPGSLVVGNAVASMLSTFLHKPIQRVNHIYGHIFSLLLDRTIEELVFPWLILTASGGHNELYIVEQVEAKKQNLKITKLGYSLDDAAGESFDKVARMLGGTYPGGPRIDRMAEKSKGNKDFHFKRIMLDENNMLNFSFSGMKSQAYQLLQKRPLETLSEQDKADICWEFQECVTDILVNKLQWAAVRYNAKTI